MASGIAIHLAALTHRLEEMDSKMKREHKPANGERSADFKIALEHIEAVRCHLRDVRRSANAIRNQTDPDN